MDVAVAVMEMVQCVITSSKCSKMRRYMIFKSTLFHWQTDQIYWLLKTRMVYWSSCLFQDQQKTIEAGSRDAAVIQWLVSWRDEEEWRRSNRTEHECKLKIFYLFLTCCLTLRSALGDKKKELKLYSCSKFKHHLHIWDAVNCKYLWF